MAFEQLSYIALLVSIPAICTHVCGIQCGEEEIQKLTLYSQENIWEEVFCTVFETVSLSNMKFCHQNFPLLIVSHDDWTQT